MGYAKGDLSAWQSGLQWEHSLEMCLVALLVSPRAQLSAKSLARRTDVPRELGSARLSGPPRAATLGSH